MYIKSARITNIRSIEDFEINFEEPAGWHVLIGDNGSGKSTIIRSLALALVGPKEAMELRGFWKDWLSNNEVNGMIWLLFKRLKSESYSQLEETDFDSQRMLNANVTIRFRRLNYSENTSKNFIEVKSSDYTQAIADKEFFSVAYGPYRRFTGGDSEMSKIFEANPKVGAHLSVFGENVALTEPIEWLMKLNYKDLERRLNNSVISHSNEHNESIIESLKKLINSSNFLPNNAKLEEISSEGVFFKDANGYNILVNQLSDGYRSILSLTLELIRQLIKFYGEDAVFKNIRKNQEDNMNIDLSGVVLIDEIDAHLHPTWQTKIGHWFLKYFPNIQFIVTTHSPLVCRAAEKGTIWKLAAPGSGEKSEQVTGIDRDRLIYGNILDAYGTEEFGIVDNIKAVHKKEELVRLSKKQLAGKISPEEENKLHKLRAIFSTDATIEL